MMCMPVNAFQQQTSGKKNEVHFKLCSSLTRTIKQQFSEIKLNVPPG